MLLKSKKVRDPIFWIKQVHHFILWNLKNLAYVKHRYHCVVFTYDLEYVYANRLTFSLIVRLTCFLTFSNRILIVMLGYLDSDRDYQ